MKPAVFRRGATVSPALLEQRHIFALSAGAKGRVELAHLASAWPDAVWQEFTSGHEFLRAASSLGVGCVVAFDPLPDLETLSVVAWLGEQRPDLGCIVITSQPSLKDAVGCLKAGATDYLEMPLDREAAATALRSVFEPGPERPSRSSALARLRLSSRLSQRELQVLDGLIAGMSNREVGAKLRISERTVEVHRSRIMRRLGVESFAELIRIAVMAGLGVA